ncbi:CPBP family intramembrane glutamic endopeptidase [Neobacillus cucumis]|uniref:CPBP family intramembrane glutamic endopeptidase n=1 Tax=Neobacillus cucumis TaxID=1740721 RepID=UPI00196648AC|nr:CPBP family intramembrane glutamic endopeptidase [Neobacillus cucumis]MBM7651475.1 membrane protease YdiL (CAAX protease family) [Neobacillus cucumis]
MKRKYNQIISALSDKELLYHLYLTQIILLVLSLILGAVLYDHFSYLKKMDWKDVHIISIGFPVGVMIVIVDILLMKWLPASYYDDGGLNERIFKNKHVFHTFFIAIIVAFSEELLFRGIIQTKVGLILASIIFAIIHYRYLFNFFLFLNITLLSFFIGIIYNWTGNLAVTIMMHFVIDFLLGVYIKLRQTSNDDLNKQGGTAL